MPGRRSLGQSWVWRWHVPQPLLRFC